MDYLVSAMDFRNIVGSMISVENERLSQYNLTTHPEFQLVDGVRKINVPDEGTLILKSDEKRVSPSMPLFRLRKAYHQWLAGVNCNHSTIRVQQFLDDNFRAMEENLKAVQKSQDEIVIPSDSDTILERIMPCICKTSRNQDALADVPHREILDLSVYYRMGVDLPEDIEGVGSTVVSNRMLEQWNLRFDHPITEETLYECAYENEKKISRIMDMTYMADVVSFCCGQEDRDRLYVMPEPEYGKMYVVTNCYKQNGAADIWMGIGLDEFVGQKEMDFFILPSSVHEAILTADNGDFSPEELAEFVAMTNASQVAEDEVLSDTVYHYDHLTKSIQIAYSPDEIKPEESLTQENEESYSMGQTSHRRGR